MNTKITLEVDHYEYLTIKKILSLPKMELENFMKTQMTSDINVTHKPTRFPGREVPSWMHEELSKKDATAPTLNPETERELEKISSDSCDWCGCYEGDLYNVFEQQQEKLKQFIAKVEQRARDEGIEKGKLKPFDSIKVQVTTEIEGRTHYLDSNIDGFYKGTYEPMMSISVKIPKIVAKYLTPPTTNEREE
jgi:hypothetical protein